MGGEPGPAVRILSPSPKPTDGAVSPRGAGLGVIGSHCGAGAVLLSAIPHRSGGFVPT